MNLIRLLVDPGVHGTTLAISVGPVNTPSTDARGFEYALGPRVFIHRNPFLLEQLDTDEFTVRGMGELQDAYATLPACS